MKLARIFKKSKNIIIGAVHLPPLLGHKEFAGFDVVLENALADVKALEDGGVDGIIFENNYDIPHKIFVDTPTIGSMTFVGERLRRATKLPLGISVLWNDYRAALSIAKTLDLQFVRVPVFVDKVKTDYGFVHGEPQKVIDFRNSIGGEKIAILTDIHVKHAELLSRHSLVDSASLAVKSKSDALIVSGKWTGDAPTFEEIKCVRKRVKSFPILIGSGVDGRNVKELFQFANGAIVGTSLKSGAKKLDQVNVKPHTERIVRSKVKKLIDCLG